MNDIERNCLKLEYELKELERFICQFDSIDEFLTEKESFLNKDGIRTVKLHTTPTSFISKVRLFVQRSHIKTNDTPSIEQALSDFGKSLLKLLELSTKGNYLWLYCSVEVYKTNYPTKLEYFLSLYPDATEQDFIQEEINMIQLVISDDATMCEHGCPISQRHGLYFGCVALREALPDNEYKNLEYNQKRKVEYLTSMIQNQNIQLSAKPSEPLLETNPYPRIFKDFQAFELFCKLKEVLVVNPLADYSFIFRRMQKDRFIFEDISEKSFRSWLNSEYEINIEYKFKLLEYCTTDRKKRIYSMALN